VQPTVCTGCITVGVTQGATTQVCNWCKRAPNKYVCALWPLSLWCRATEKAGHVKRDKGVPRTVDPSNSSAMCTKSQNLTFHFNTMEHDYWNTTNKNEGKTRWGVDELSTNQSLMQSAQPQTPFLTPGTWNIRRHHIGMEAQISAPQGTQTALAASHVSAYPS